MLYAHWLVRLVKWFPDIRWLNGREKSFGSRKIFPSSNFECFKPANKRNILVSDTYRT